MDRPEKKPLHIREFLNDLGFHSVAAVHVHMHPRGGSVIISDCNRQINLDLWHGYDDADKANAVLKLDRIIGALQKARKYLKDDVKVEQDVQV